MFFDTIMREAFKALLRNKVRSVLTMLGIIAGVGSFICVVGVGEAGSKRVEEQLHNVGDNLVWLEAGGRARNGVRVGSRGSKTLTLGDCRAVLDQVPGIKSGSPNVDGHIQVVSGSANWGNAISWREPRLFRNPKMEYRARLAFHRRRRRTGVDRLRDRGDHRLQLIRDRQPGW